MKEYFVVDRIEEHNFIILESFKGDIINIEKNMCDVQLKEGDVIFKEKEKFYLDADATIRRKERLRNITKDIWE